MYNQSTQQSTNEPKSSTLSPNGKNRIFPWPNPRVFTTHPIQQFHLRVQGANIQPIEKKEIPMKKVQWVPPYDPYRPKQQIKLGFKKDQIEEMSTIFAKATPIMRAQIDFLKSGLKCKMITHDDFFKKIVALRDDSVKGTIPSVKSNVTKKMTDAELKFDQMITELGISPALKSLIDIYNSKTTTIQERSTLLSGNEKLADAIRKIAEWNTKERILQATTHSPPSRPQEPPVVLNGVSETELNFDRMFVELDILRLTPQEKKLINDYISLTSNEQRITMLSKNSKLIEPVRVLNEWKEKLKKFQSPDHSPSIPIVENNPPSTPIRIELDLRFEKMSFELNFTPVEKEMIKVYFSLSFNDQRHQMVKTNSKLADHLKKIAEWREKYDAKPVSPKLFEVKRFPWNTPLSNSTKRTQTPQLPQETVPKQTLRPKESQKPMMEEDPSSEIAKIEKALVITRVNLKNAMNQVRVPYDSMIVDLLQQLNDAKEALVNKTNPQSSPLKRNRCESDEFNTKKQKIQVENGK